MVRWSSLFRLRAAVSRERAMAAHSVLYASCARPMWTLSPFHVWFFFHTTAYQAAPSSVRDPSVKMTRPGCCRSASYFWLPLRLRRLSWHRNVPPTPAMPFPPFGPDGPKKIRGCFSGFWAGWSSDVRMAAVVSLDRAVLGIPRNQNCERT